MSHALQADSSPTAIDYSMTRACRQLWRAYGSSAMAHRLLAAVRPFIACFDRIIGYVPPGASILDIGCGSGLLLALIQLHRPVRQAVGVDVNAKAIAAAESMTAANGFPFSFHVSESASGWPQETFDVVLMIDVLHHVPAASRRDVIAAALARISPNGLFIYKDMCARPAFRRIWNQCHDLILAQQLVTVEPIEHVVDWVVTAGFSRLTSQRYVGAAFYGHELEVFRRPATDRV